jgi:hypothetical protein
MLETRKADPRDAERANAPQRECGLLRPLARRRAGIGTGRARRIGSGTDALFFVLCAKQRGQS